MTLASSQLPNKIYNWKEKLCEELNRPGLVIDDSNPENIDINSIIKDACEVLMSPSKRQWQVDIKNSPKLRTYILCKCD